MRTSILLAAAMGAFAAFSQTPPSIEWQHRYGGSALDLGWFIRPTSDGGYIASATTYSNDGDINCLHGFEYDFWPLRFNLSGELQWSHCYGGTLSEGAPHDIIEADGGGYLLAGTVQSNDGDVTCDMDIGAKLWLARLASDGDVLWDICPVGVPTNNYSALCAAHDGGWLLGGRTFNIASGQGCGMGGGDVWLAHIDDDGQVLWSRCYGGSATDHLNEIRPTSDGGYIMVGGTRSNDGDIAGMNPYPNAGDSGWIIKLDPTGDILWQHVYGGSGVEHLHAVAEDAGGGFWAVGYTTSTDGHVIGQHGGEDIWILRTDAQGLLLGQRCLGGMLNERTMDLALLPNGHALITGVAQSNDGDLVGHHGGNDGWVVEMAPDLEIVWQRAIGGTGSDRLNSAAIAPDGGVVLMGYSSSTDGDLAEVPHAGQWDVWILKLAPWSGTGVEDQADETGILLFPNPTTGDLQLDFGPLSGPGWNLEIVDALGRVAHIAPNINATQQRYILPTHGLAQGSYAVRLHRNGESHVKRFIKQ